MSPFYVVVRAMHRWPRSPPKPLGGGGQDTLRRGCHETARPTGNGEPAGHAPPTSRTPGGHLLGVSGTLVNGLGRLLDGAVDIASCELRAPQR